MRISGLSSAGCEPGIREGCPYISSDHMKFDELLRWMPGFSSSRHKGECRGRLILCRSVCVLVPSSSPSHHRRHKGELESPGWMLGALDWSGLRELASCSDQSGDVQGFTPLFVLVQLKRECQVASPFARPRLLRWNIAHSALPALFACVFPEKGSLSVNETQKSARVSQEKPWAEGWEWEHLWWPKASHNEFGWALPFSSFPVAYTWARFDQLAVAIRLLVSGEGIQEEPFFSPFSQTICPERCLHCLNY